MLDPDTGRFLQYRFEPQRYIEEKLYWRPWSAAAGATGQVQVLEAYELALRQLHERKDYRDGVLTAAQLKHWQPDDVIQNYIAIDAGHTVGKTKLLAGLVSHFFDCFPPAIVYCFAPTSEQINDLLFKEIRVDRAGRTDLPGRVLQTPRIVFQPDHFVKGKATSDANSSGTERAQGQHGDYLMFVLDEAEGIPDFVWDAVSSMASGGIVIVIIARNPRTRSSMAHKIRERPFCKPFRISCLDHPNVLQNREVVRASVTRDYVESMLEHTSIVDVHDEDRYTLELPWRPGTIYQPHEKFLWRVLGIPASFDSTNTFCTSGRYEAAARRPAYADDPAHVARLGLDSARFGSDYGTLYVRHDGRVWRAAQFARATTTEYFMRTKQVLLELKEMGVTDVEIRADAGGGYSGGAIDQIEASHELQSAFEFIDTVEVHFQSTPYDATQFADCVTEMTYHSGQSLKHLALIDPPAELETDLCERTYKYMKRTHNKIAYDVMKLDDKERFRKLHGRSPDDGDGLVLCVAPDYIFTNKVNQYQRTVYDPVKIGTWR